MLDFWGGVVAGAVVICGIVGIILSLNKQNRDRCEAVQKDIFPRLDKLEVRVGVLERKTHGGGSQDGL